MTKKVQPVPAALDAALGNARRACFAADTTENKLRLRAADLRVFIWRQSTYVQEQAQLLGERMAQDPTYVPIADAVSQHELTLLRDATAKLIELRDTAFALGFQL